MITHKMSLAPHFHMRFAHVPTYIEGEFQFSYLHRLARANAYESFPNLYNSTHGDNVIPTTTRIDSSRYAYFDAVESLSPDYNWFINASLYKDLSPFLSTELIGNKIKAIDFGSDLRTLIPQVISLTPHIKLCPECCKEDYKQGIIHLRKINQIEEVTICPIHGCRLMQFNDRPITYTNDIFDITNYNTLPEDTWTIEDSQFLMKVLDAHLEGTLANTARIIYAKLCSYFHTKLYLEDMTDKLFADPKFKAVTNNTLLDFLFRKDKLRITLDKTIPFIRVLYDNDVDSFISDLSTFTAPFREDVVLGAIPDGYKLSSPYSPIIMELQNTETGARFPFTAKMLMDGWPMPDTEFTKEDLMKDLVAKKLAEGWKVVNPPAEWSKNMVLEEPGTKTHYKTTLRKFIEYGDIGRMDVSEVNLKKYQSIVSDLGEYELISTKGSNLTLKLNIKCLKCGSTFWVLAEDFKNYTYCPHCGCGIDESETKIALAIKNTTNGHFKWKGNLGDGKFAASAFKGGKKTIETSNISELIRKLRFDKDGSKQEKGIVKAISHIIHIAVLKNPNKIFIAQDFFKYGLKRHVNEALAELDALGIIKNIESTLFHSTSISPSKPELIDAYYINKNGVGIGDTLLRQIGYDLESERYTYILQKQGKNANTTVHENFMGCDVTIVYKPIVMATTNQNSVALLATIENKNLMSHWSEEEEEALRTWAKSAIDTPRYMTRLNANFSQETISTAIAMVEGTR